MIVLPTSSAMASLAANNLGAANARMEKALQRLSSGTRLVGTRDDAAGTAISVNLTATLNRIGAVETNLLNADSFVNVQEEALKSVGDLVTRMHELKVLSQDATKNAGDIKNYAVEYWQLAAEIRQIGQRTFNGIPLFSGTDKEELLKCRATENGGHVIDLVLPPLKEPSLLDVFGEHIYKVISGVMDWYDAEADAESKGGHLATITSSAEWKEVVWQLGNDAVTKDPLWIGLKQRPVSQEPAFGWDWVTGETLDYKKWMAGEPDNDNNFNPNPSADGLAWNQACAVLGHMGDELLDNSTGSVSGYIIQYTDSNNVTKYKAVRNDPLTWDQARVAAYDASNPNLPAGAMNPHLATLKTKAEVDAAKQQISVEQGVPLQEILWLGGYQSLPGGGVESASNVREYWHWIAETLPDPSKPASDSTNDKNPAVDPQLNWGSLFPHGNQPNNLSSSAINEDVGYISGPFGEWGDSTEDPSQKNIKGYLFEKDNDFTKIPLDGLVKTLEWVAHYRAVCGAESSRIRFAHDAASTMRVNLEAARSRITDTDVSRETILLARNKVLVESGVKMLQTAHESMQVALKLLGN